MSQEDNFGLPGYSYSKFIKRELKWTEQWEKFFFCAWPHIALVKEKFGYRYLQICTSVCTNDLVSICTEISVNAYCTV